MKTVILCGGRGTRLGEHGLEVPKPLLPIGGHPILWHIMTIYSHFGLNEFVLCLGHLAGKIRSCFEDNDSLPADWKITMRDTGPDTNTGGRISRVRAELENEDVFCVTYGDGLADVDLDALIAFHKSHGRIGTLTAVRPHLNFGLLSLGDGDKVTEFHEKPLMEDWINGGFFVFNREIFDYLGDNDVLEREPLEGLVRDGELVAFRHTGFWKCLDTYKDYLEFKEISDAGRTPWKPGGRR